MPKKKVRKEEPKKGFQYTKELEGLFLILFGVIGFGNFGIVGDVIKKFSIFMFGNWYVILLVLSLILGIYLIAKRKGPNYFSARLIGLYTILIAILLYSHLGYIENTKLEGVEILRTTIDNIMVAASDIGEIKATGGGIIGALFSFLFVKLFDIEGTKIVVIVLAFFGVIMLFDLNIVNIFKAIFKPLKNIGKKSSEETEEVSEGEVKAVSADDNIKEETPEEIDKRIVITSMDDLKQNNHNISYEPPMAVEEQTLDIPNAEEKPYKLPSLDLLDDGQKLGKINSTEFITSNTKIIERVLRDFAIVGKVVEVHQGPAVTQFEVELKSGTKVSKVLSINREIALALAAKEVRIQAPIPGKSTIGIEIPNMTLHPVIMKDILRDMPKKYADNKLVAPLGMNIMGQSEFVEINKTPHMLIAGATGSGKSVCINNIITTILLRTKPDEVKLVLVDPKKVELNVYDNVPHLLIPVVTDPKKASVALQKIVIEMDRRYDIFNESLTKNLESYNEYVEKYNKKHSEAPKKKLPYILVIIDELADLMLVAAKDVEESIMRITQLARAAGIHLIVATQRPSTDVITGLIKSNIPTRISFAVSSSIDSRTILDATGAEKLLGKGDMLFWPMGAIAPTRIQGSMLKDEEIKRVVQAVRSQTSLPSYDENMINLDKPTNTSAGQSSSGEFNEDGDDPLYNEIVEFVIKTGKVSASLLQRKYRLGYNRAARIIDILEERGIIGPQNGSKPREVLVKLEDNN